jgi:hypothetical protein
LVTVLSEIAVLFPARAPIIEPIIDKTNPPKINIHKEVVKRIGSLIKIMTSALQIMGTYQMLPGFFLIIIVRSG